MQYNIGEVAGNIWQALSEREELPITQLPKAINERETVTYQGLGWLAREGKVEYRTAGKRTFISLTK